MLIALFSGDKITDNFLNDKTFGQLSRFFVDKFAEKVDLPLENGVSER